MNCLTVGNCPKEFCSIHRKEWYTTVKNKVVGEYIKMWAFVHDLLLSKKAVYRAPRTKSIFV